VRIGADLPLAATFRPQRRNTPNSIIGYAQNVFAAECTQDDDRDTGAYHGNSERACLTLLRDSVGIIKVIKTFADKETEKLFRRTVSRKFCQTFNKTRIFFNRAEH
jgi:hypothetical protein